jgi:hypothetical protein
MADGDKPLPEDDAIAAAHPLRTGRHDLHEEAHRLVSAKHSKGALVALVNWLLLRLEPEEFRRNAEAKTSPAFAGRARLAHNAAVEIERLRQVEEDHKNVLKAALHNEPNGIDLVHRLTTYAIRQRSKV